LLLPGVNLGQEGLEAGRLMRMAGRGAVVFEEFSDFQFDFSPLLGEPQVVSDGLLEYVWCFELQRGGACRWLEPNAEKHRPEDAESCSTPPILD
jgi:hypothetical protein